MCVHSRPIAHRRAWFVSDVRPPVDRRRLSPGFVTDDSRVNVRGRAGPGGVSSLTVPEGTSGVGLGRGVSSRTVPE